MASSVALPAGPALALIPAYFIFVSFVPFVVQSLSSTSEERRRSRRLP
jgi:hypothetical protein